MPRIRLQDGHFQVPLAFLQRWGITPTIQSDPQGYCLCFAVPGRFPKGDRIQFGLELSKFDCSEHGCRRCGSSEYMVVSKCDDCETVQRICAICLSQPSTYNCPVCRSRRGRVRSVGTYPGNVIHEVSTDPGTDDHLTHEESSFIAALDAAISAIPLAVIEALSIVTDERMYEETKSLYDRSNAHGLTKAKVRAAAVQFARLEKVVPD